jgi:hypothetical protein
MIGKALEAVLKARRADYNQRFKLAQQHYRALTAEDWLAFMSDTLNAVAESVAAHDESAVPAVIDALYDQTLPLVAQCWLSREPREPVLVASYRQLLVALAPALASEPARVSGALLNALHHLCVADAQRAQEWTQRLGAIAGKSGDVEAVLALGRVLAWRMGLPAYRESALRAGPQLPLAWAQKALDLSAPPNAALWEALAQSPALRADEAAAVRNPGFEWLVWSGGYRGLGGPFAKQPMVGLAGGKLAASDGENTWWLAADGYGAQAVRMGSAADWPLDTLSALAKAAADGTVAVGKNVRKFAELETARAAAWHAGIVAVTLRTSYQVALLRCPPP